jgi:hypothetical protein
MVHLYFRFYFKMILNDYIIEIQSLLNENKKYSQIELVY